MPLNKNLVSKRGKRLDRWSDFINHYQSTSVLEIGVYKGFFAAELLKQCQHIEEYYMLDPWRNMAIEDWNSVYNVSENMDDIYAIAMENTKPYEQRRKVLRGTTAEKIHEIEDESLDFIYIDGDHSLKGITIDLIKCWDKVKPNGYIAGHDFKTRAWKSRTDMEPYLVFPYAIYFAEAMDTKIYGLPSNEFLIAKEEKGFEFIDLTPNQRFEDKDLLSQVYKLPYRYLWKVFLKKIFG